MTHQQALEYKANKISPFNYNGVLMSIIIAPYSEIDFNSFTDYYKANKIDDFTAKSFSSDNKFEVYGFGPRIELFYYLKLS